MQAQSPDAGATATVTAMAVVVVGASLLTSMTHERRVAKMVGPAGEPVYAGAGRMWLGLFALLASTSVALLQSSRPEALFRVWMFGVGCGFAVWGSRAGFRWYLGLGVSMVAAGLLDLVLVATGGPVVPLRIFVLGLALPVTALLTNRRYLWLRPQSRS